MSPLGAAALAGTSLPIDRQETAQLLGFEDVARNSLDVSSDRDYMVEFVLNLSLISAHLSSWAEEWIIWFSCEFGFIQLPDAFTTGSSIMPQKKNPDVLELIRGKTARVMADVSQLLVLIKGLPMAYNRDLQEDKLALFDAFDTVEACLEVAPALIAGAELQVDRINEKIDDGFLDATALMEYLIKRGVPMRTGHGTVGKLVAECEGPKLPVERSLTRRSASGLQPDRRIRLQRPGNSQRRRRPPKLRLRRQSTRRRTDHLLAGNHSAKQSLRHSVICT